MQIEAEITKAGLVKMTDEDVIDGLLADVGAGLLAGKEPVFTAGPMIGGADIGDQEVISLVREDSIAVRAVLAAGDVNAVL